MKLVEKNKDTKKFILAEDSGAFTFRISDDYNSQFFMLSVDELRALRDVISHYIQECDRSMVNSLNNINSLNNFNNQTNTSTNPVSSNESNLSSLPTMNFDAFNDSQTEAKKEENKEEEKIVFEFF